MSLFSSGHVLSGAHWRYRILEPIQGDQSHFSTVFKAEVLADDAVSSAPTWFVPVLTALHHPMKLILLTQGRHQSSSSWQ